MIPHINCALIVLSLDIYSDVHCFQILVWRDGLFEPHQNYPTQLALQSAVVSINNATYMVVASAWTDACTVYKWDVTSSLFQPYQQLPSQSMLLIVLKITFT